MGDFNDLLWGWEKHGRVSHPGWLLRGFQEAVRESGLEDMGFEGCQFTWEQGRGTQHWVQEKLDRVLVSGAWRDVFRNAQAWSLEESSSDHLPIFLKLNARGKRDFRRLPRFENAWGNHPLCRDVVSELWLRAVGDDLGDRLRDCGRRVWRWGRGQANKEGRELAECKERMGRLRTARGEGEIREFGEVQRHYLSLMQNQSDRFCQRAKELRGWGRVLRCVERRVTEVQNEGLLRQVTSEEVRGALFAMHLDKSPGPDGLSPAFFQLHWDILGEEVVSFCKSFILHGQLPVSLGETHIALIPKLKKPELLSDFRPISLCMYRILAKVLANRFRNVLDFVISPSQSAFIPGRSIVENVLIAYESTHALNRFQGSGGGYGVLKVDMSKAYDRVECDFMTTALLNLGFVERWVDLMRVCVSSVRYWVLVEGVERGPIVPTRGLRQGDPLSPCLFIVVAECLSSMLREQEEVGALHGIRVARAAPSISHLFFADDCLFFFRANNLEAGVIKAILMEYGEASGQKVNLGKTSIVFGKAVQREDKEAVCEVLGIHEQRGRGNYFGLPGLVRRNKRQVLGFVRDKVRARVLHWGNRFLSRAGREVLLKTVLQSIPNYAMNVFLLPRTLCGEIERIMNAFWWGCERRNGKGIRRGTWSDLCQPKKYGGWGEQWVYSVKNGYRRVKGCRDGAGMRVWAGVWGLDIPPKVRCDPTCVLCGIEPETIVHLFANCPFSRECWSEVDRGWRFGEVESIDEWVVKMWEALPKTVLETVVVVCWALWEGRNAVVWNMHTVESSSLVLRAKLYIANWRAARRKEGVPRLGGEDVDHFEHWNPPLGLHLKSPGVYLVREAVAMGAREALSWIKKIGWPRIVLETDAQLVTNAVQKGLNITPFGEIIDDIRLLLGSIEDSSITFVRRSANETAHVLARKALCNRDFALVEFFDAIPRCISATIAMH
ncbi:uncharacterized protein LOC115995902 [Ipomoea triloba]|uniref:uncharacterized protein LOC115995902 n=1 Tax=Ipomoea triloba TaxID=35885 RepID=UPI00125E4915|nr:uncharacterized protein LOC115995902 [Ipomoea triloba]